MRTKIQALYDRMAQMISGVAGIPCEIALVGKGTYISIVFDGKAQAACEKLEKFFGSKYDRAEYDEELDATYAGINLQ